MRLNYLSDQAHSTSSKADQVRIVRRRRESMRLPVDTSSIAFLCALEPQPVLAFDTKQPRADENGEPLYVVQLIALGDGEAEILAVKVPGQPSQAIARATRSRCMA